jgi:glucose dehydrogenase
VTIAGVTFESYDDTLKWFTTHCHKDDWKYVMDMPALYSLVKTDGKNLKALLEGHSHSSKAG